MAYLYETATWRAIVKATRDPKLMGLFVITTTAGAYAVAKTSEILTAPASEETKKEMQKTIKKDYEANRYARHSKQALAVMFDTIKNDGERGSTPETSGKPQIKLPGVMWHPKVAQQEKEARMQRKRQTESRATSSLEQTATRSNADERRETQS